MEGIEEVGMTEERVDGAGPSQRAHHAGGDGPAPRPRMSAKRKQGAVLRLLRGEPIEVVSRELGVTAAELSAWRDAFLAAGEASLKTRPADDRDAEIARLKGVRLAVDGDRTGHDDRDAEIARLKGRVGDLTMASELLEAKIDALEGSRPLARRRSRR